MEGTNMTRKGTFPTFVRFKNFEKFFLKSKGKEHFGLWLAEKFFLALYKRKPHFLFNHTKLVKVRKRGIL